jgi:hypothetical protein
VSFQQGRSVAVACPAGELLVVNRAFIIQRLLKVFQILATACILGKTIQTAIEKLYLG